MKKETVLLFLYFCKYIKKICFCLFFVDYYVFLSYNIGRITLHCFVYNIILGKLNG